MSASRSSRCQPAATADADKVTARVALIALCLMVQPAPSAPPDGYRLVWSDEFDTDGMPDPAKWAYDTEANATGWYNDEQQYYAVANPANSVQSDGILHITARHERLTEAADYGGQDYSSARLITKDRADWTYGYFEASARLPCGQGAWPAFWMLGPASIPYPLRGEIDIMEQISSDPTIHGTLHTKATEGTYGIGGSSMALDPCTTFHRYQMLWTPQRITVSLDDKSYFTFDNPGTGRNAWPYDLPHFILLNLAVGGDWPGRVDDSIFPVSFDIDYVRVYQE